MQKKRLLFTTDLATTGFGRVGMEIVTRFAQTGLYDICYVGWAAVRSGDMIEKFRKMGVQCIPVQNTLQDQFGQQTVPQVIDRFKPDLVWSLGDPWMVAYIKDIPGFQTDWKWISYVPIDREELVSDWLPALKAPDALVLYSDFGREVVEKYLPRVKTEVIYHGVDTDVFRPLDRAEMKKKHGLDPSTAVIGFVGRNQIRKRIPRLMHAFKFWNCQNFMEDRVIEVNNNGQLEKWNARDYARSVCKMRAHKWLPYFKQDPRKANTALYLHTTQGYTDQNDGPSVGWNLSEYSDRLGLNENIWGAPSRIMMPDQQQMNAVRGIPDANLAEAYNLIDIAVLPSSREGFGLPILEAASCGIPTIVTNYSSMPELMGSGRGYLVDPIDFDDEPFFDAPSALISIEELADTFDEVMGDFQNGTMQRKAKMCRQWALSLDWKHIFKDFHRLVKELLA